MNPFPYAARGQTIGLLGGSFDPAHQGHVHITEAALKRFNLDRVWWMVSPGNPLKAKGPAPIEQRVSRALHIMLNPRVNVNSLETFLGTRYTAETLKALKKHCPHVRFVWLMGADNLAQFHLWQDWQWIMENVPVGVIARPGDRIAARMSKAGRIYRHARLSGRSSQLLARSVSPAWCFINLPMSAQSSTAIRAEGEWGQGEHE